MITMREMAGALARRWLNPTGSAGLRDYAVMAFWDGVARLQRKSQPGGLSTLSSAAADPDRYVGSFFKEHLLHAVLPFWKQYGWDTEHGGFFSYLDRQGRPLSANKFSGMHARAIYGCTLGFEVSGDPVYRCLAEQGVEYLLTRLWDEQHGGCFALVRPCGTVLNDAKRMFDQTYVLLALTAYARATGDAAVWPTIHRLLELIETHLYANGGYATGADRRWQITNPMRNASVHTNMLNVMLTLAACTGEPRYREHAVAIAGMLCNRMLDTARGCLLETFSPVWVYQPLSSRDRVEIGHNLKAAWLLFRLGALTGDPDFAGASFGFLTYARRFGWDPVHGGFFHQVFRPGQLASTHKEFWVQCNGLLALRWAAKIRNDLRDRDDFARQADFVFNHLADGEYGEWYTSCYADGTPRITYKAGPNKSAFYTTHTCAELVQLEIS